MRRKIAIDIDDVIADSTEALRIVVNNHLGIDLQPDDYKSVEAEYWGYYEEVWRTHGVQNFSFEDVEHQMSNDQSHVPMLAGAEFALHELYKKFDIVLITSRDVKWKKATDKWLKVNLPKIELEVYFTNSTKVKKSKGEICKQLQVDLLIDDNPEHCKSAIEHGLDTILFGNYGWQNNVDSAIKRCEDWPEVLDYLS